MNKTLVYKSIFLQVLTICLTMLALQAQTVEFKVTGPRVVAIGEQFQLTWEVNAKSSNFQPPAFSDFRLLQGPNTGSSSSINLINGKTLRVEKYTFSYLMLAQQEGKFTIQPASISVNGKTYNSNAISIEVVKGQAKSASGNTAGDVSVSDDDLFVRIDLSRTQIYQGEHIVATMKVYSRTNSIEFTNAKFPSLDGFFSTDIENTPKQLFRENYNNEVYFVGIFKQQILIPQRSGTITIEAFELDSRVNVQTGYGRDFFGRTVPQYKTLVVKRASKPREVEVKALPTNKPASFSGAVGTFTLRSSIDKTELKANEPITLKYSIQGRGNLKLIGPFEIKFPNDFDPFDPKVKENIKTDENGVSGSKTFEYLVIPRYAGEFTIPAVNFSYFDTQSGSYKTIQTDSYTVNVEKGSEETTSFSSGNLNKKEIAFIGQDIRYIKTKNDLSLKKSNLISELTFISLFPAALILFFVLLVLLSFRTKQKGNAVLMKNKQAGKKAGKFLKKATDALKQNQETLFYDALLQALYGYLADKMSIPLSELNKERIGKKLNEGKLPVDIQEKLYHLLDTCEFARYAPTAGSSEMNELLKTAEELIYLFEKHIKT